MFPYNDPAMPFGEFDPDDVLSAPDATPPPKYVGPAEERKYLPICPRCYRDMHPTAFIPWRRWDAPTEMCRWCGCDTESGLTHFRGTA